MTERTTPQLAFHHLATQAATRAEQWKLWANHDSTDTHQATRARRIAALLHQQATLLLEMHRYDNRARQITLDDFNERNPQP